MIIIVSRCCPSKLKFMGFPVNINCHVQNPGRRNGPLRNLDGVDSKRFTAKDSLKRPQLLVDDRIKLFKVDVFAARSGSVTLIKRRD